MTDITQDDANKALDYLVSMFDAYENGIDCKEDGEPDGAYMGKCFKLDELEFNEIAALLDKHRPVIKGVKNEL